MGLNKYVKDAWRKQDHAFREMHRHRLVQWRTETATIRIDKPTRLDRARALGYRAKQGVIIVRQRVDRGGRQRPAIRAGRRTAHNYQKKILNKSYQQVAEERANSVYTNCEVLNSYFVGQDAIYFWYEVILLDNSSPAIRKDPVYIDMLLQRGRSYRGLTSAARKSRGLNNKGRGSEKN